MSGQYMTAHQVKRYLEMQQEISELLAEVKRLREENERLRDMIEKAVGYGAYDEEYWGGEE
jgi:hypothetical protein